MKRFVYLALALSACGAERVEETALERFRFEARPGRPRIEVRIEDGSVEVQGVAGTRTIEAEFTKKARSFDRETASTLLPRIEVSANEVEEGARFRFEGRAESIPPFGGDLRTDLKLRVPREVEIEIATEDGRIAIEGIDGRVRADSGDGRILIERASGELRLRTDDGSIVGRDLDAAIDAATDDGGIELEGAFRRLRAVTADGSIHIDCREWRTTEGWMVRALDGAIEAVLPAEAAADIDATVSDGRIESRLDAFESSSRGENDRRLRGMLGGGGPLLLFSAMDGRIELSQR